MGVQDHVTVTYSSSESEASECNKKYGLSTDLVASGLSTFEQYIYLWTKTQEEGSLYSLYFYDEALGLGTSSSAASEQIEKYITFSFQSTPDSISLDDTELVLGEESDVSFAQETLAFPAESIVSVEAVSPVVMISDTESGGGGMSTLYSKGEQIPVENFQLSTSGLCITPFFQGSNVSGTVKIIYQRVSNRKFWEVYEKLNLGQNLFFLYRDGVFQETITITMESGTEEEEVESDERTIQLLIVDHSELTPVQGASIYLDEVLMGTTDEEGYLTVDTTVGSHDLKVIATGFLASDEDDLSNDTLIVD